MGNWNCYVFEDGAWSDYETVDDLPDLTEAKSLRLFLADSDFAEVRYFPSTAPGTGSAFVGYTPRTYFETDEAPGCTDVLPDAEGLAGWAGTGVPASEIAPLLADDTTGAGEGETDDEDEDDPFVEAKLDRLVALLGLPAITW